MSAVHELKSVETSTSVGTKKALALLSGGLDSTLAVALLTKQNIDV